MSRLRELAEQGHMTGPRYLTLAQQREALVLLADAKDALALLTDGVEAAGEFTLDTEGLEVAGIPPLLARIEELEGKA